MVHAHWHPQKKTYHMHSGKIQFLALKWAICGRFRDYLFYTPHFVVYTDNNPLTYILTTAKLNATGYRWVGELADFNFIIKNRPSKRNANADGLSRLPLDINQYMAQCTAEVKQDVIKLAVNSVCFQKRGQFQRIISLVNMSSVSSKIQPHSQTRLSHKRKSEPVKKRMLPLGLF